MHSRSWKSLFIAVVLLTCLPAAASADPRGEAAVSCDEIQVFVRSGCPHCDRALTFLVELKGHNPEVTIRHYDLSSDPKARERLIALSREHGVHRPAVPSFLVCDTLLVGFDSPATTGAQLTRLLDGEAGGPPTTGEGATELPLLGKVRADELGLPLFTIALGLVDGFNPCAMWVLLFLLSLLVHVRDRLRIMLIAGTFVMVSGLVYFAFMAAWLNAFMIIGLSRTLQVTLGLIALAIGSVHLKDYFLPNAGLSLSIPDSAKPGIYTRVRRIVQAEDLTLAMVGVTLLAVMVNLVELLCTAGLPALYTQILLGQDLGKGTYYGYLLLYNLAYIFDDALIVGIAVYTLSQTKLQEKQGRWLKLTGGIVIIGLGLMLLIAPERLVL